MVYGIIAAGEGSRLRADGYQGFKPMVEIGGERLIERLLRIFLQNDATAIYIILNQSEKEVGHFIQGLEIARKLPISIIYKDTPSSFHSFYALLDSFKPADLSEVCISTIDPIFKEAQFKRYVAAFKADPSLDALMAVTPFVEDDKPLHVHIDQHFKVLRFDSKGAQDQPYVSGGIYLLRTTALAQAEPAMQAGTSKMRNFQQKLLEAGLQVKAHNLGTIIDIDHLSDIQLAESLIQSTTN